MIAGIPNPPSDGLVSGVGANSVDLQWNRPSYTGGDGVTVDMYGVSVDDQPVTVINSSSEVVRYTIPDLVYGDVLVTAINSCGQESEPATINIPAAGNDSIYIYQLCIVFFS